MKKMTKVLTTVLVIALAALTLAGCAKKDTSPVTTDGSTSMEKVIGTLGEAFTEKEGINVTYNPTGSGSGIQAVSEKRCDIGLASRNLKDEEKANGLTGTVVAIDGIAIVVNKENPVSDLTVEQIAKLYTGEITNWSELGGEDAAIAVLGREDGSGTRSAFEEIVGVDGECKYTNEYSSTGDVIGNVASNPNGIGYASLSAVTGDNTVKVLTVGGVACTEAAVLDGSYEIQRPFVLVTKQGVTLSAAAQAFFDFATSAAASDLIKNAGAVPVAK